jgi:hypothetical protein
MDKQNNDLVFEKLVALFEQTQTAMQTQAARSVDIALVVRNWLFGWYIVEYQQNGSDRAIYGKQLLIRLSDALCSRMSKGYSVDNLELIRKFYIGYSDIQQAVPVKSSIQQISETLSRILKENSESVSRNLNAGFSLEIWKTLSSRFSLSWSHYVVLLKVKSDDERRFYEIESTENSWGIRELKRQINASLYERLALSRNKAKVKELSEKGQLVSQPSDV